MSKKSSRRKRKQSKPNVPVYDVPVESADEAVSEKEAVPTQVTAPPVVATVDAAASPIDSVDWEAEYPYVAKDLRRMGIVAAAMIALLLGLNFFIG